MPLTPYEFRVKALNKIKSAEILLEHNQIDDAWENIGYSIEFLLKARICVRKNLEKFPETRKEVDELIQTGIFKEGDKLFIHEIDELIELSNTYNLQGSSGNIIDWKLLCSWSITHRYEKSNTFERENVETYIEQAKLANQEILKIELFKYFIKLENRLSGLYGPFHCNALAKENEKWWLIVLWHPKPGKTESAGRDILSAEEGLDPDIRDIFGGIYNLHKGKEGIREELFNGIKGLTQFTGKFFENTPHYFENHVIAGPGVKNPPNGLYITIANWTDKQLEERWSII